MGWFSSACSFVSSAFTSAVSAIGSCISRTLSTFTPIIARGLETWCVVGAIAEAVCKCLGIFKQDEQIEEIGDRAMQATEAGVKPDNFDRYEEYIEAIRNFDLDPKKSESYDRKDLLVMGTTVASKGLDEKLQLADGTSSHLWLMAAANPDYFSGDRLQTIITSSNPMDVINYFSGKLGPASERSVESRLVAMEKALDPEKSEKVIFQELDSAQDAMRSLNG